MTPGTTVHGVRVLGEGVPYLDGAEDRLYDIVMNSPDRSTDSDDLAGHISDWPTRYHLSRLRPNLLMGLEIVPGMRILDVGCGTGVLSRAMAERGAVVTGLEGSLARARVAAARTLGLSNCEILSGSLSEYVEEGHAGEFDAVLLCGVLEYSGSAIGGAGGYKTMLAEVQALLKPDGVSIVAIENQIGLKYLLGYPEDHRGLPWVGIDGYRSGRNPAQTWSRAVLSEILSESGLTQQEWLFPFPDYKLPTVVVRSQLFDTPEGRELIGLFIRNPVVDHSANSMLTSDPLSAFRTMLAAGIGKETANSFLVIAGRDGSNPGNHLANGMLWASSGERSAELMDRRVLLKSDDGWRLSPRSDRAQVHLPPLISVRTDVPVVFGSNLEDEIVALAARVESPRELAPLLDEWWAASLPWLQGKGDDGGYHFDIMPRNFIRAADGELHYIDREWIWADDVPASWALIRSLMYLIRDRMWPAGAAAGLSWKLTMQEAIHALGSVVASHLGEEDYETFVGLEAELQSKVGVAPAESVREVLTNLLRTPLSMLAEQPIMAQVLERPAIAEDRWREAELKELQARDDILGQQALTESLKWKVGELEGRVAWLQERLGPNPRFAARRAKQKAKATVKRGLRSFRA